MKRLKLSELPHLVVAEAETKEWFKGRFNGNQCSVCEKIVVGEDAQKQHWYYNHGEEVVCQECDWSGPKRKLAKHRRKHDLHIAQVPMLQAEDEDVCDALRYYNIEEGRSNRQVFS